MFLSDVITPRGITFRVLRCRCHAPERPPNTRFSFDFVANGKHRHSRETRNVNLTNKSGKHCDLRVQRSCCAAAATWLLWSTVVTPRERTAVNAETSRGGDIDILSRAPFDSLSLLCRPRRRVTQIPFSAHSYSGFQSLFLKMFILTILFFILHVVGYVQGATDYAECKTNVMRPNGNYKFSCLGLISLHSYMEKGPSNATDISIVNSKLTAIPRYSFVRFGTTLETLELRNCGIERIEPEGFASLFRLQKLVLAENNLIKVSAEWFRDSSYLRELDVSFNKIIIVDYAVYQLLSNLEVFYFDYNQLVTIDYSMFSLLGYLRKVKLGHNPWNWGYRIRLTWQLDNQRVNYEDDWEEWGWMSSTVRECEENGDGVVPNETILDCVVRKLLNMEVGNTHNISSPGTQKIALEGRCFNEVTTLVHCTTRSVPPRESVRRSLEGLAATLKDMGPPGAKFTYNV